MAVKDETNGAGNTWQMLVKRLDEASRQNQTETNLWAERFPQPSSAFVEKTAENNETSQEHAR
jgi:hypothetical protein